MSLEDAMDYAVKKVEESKEKSKQKQQTEKLKKEVQNDSSS